MLDKSYFWNGILENGEVQIFTQNASKFLNSEKITENDEWIIRDYRTWYEKNFTQEEIKLIQKALRVKNDGIIGRKTLQVIFSYGLDTRTTSTWLLTRWILQNFAKNFQNITQKSYNNTANLAKDIHYYKVNTPILNENYLRKQIDINLVKNISAPTPQELISILQNQNLKNIQWNAYIYAIQSGLSMLGYMENMKYIDGIFGSNTRADLQEFQKAYQEKFQISKKNFWKIDNVSINTLQQVLKSL